MTGDVTAVIVSYNVRELLLRCIAALRTDGVTDIVVVDNASRDGSADAVKEVTGSASEVVFEPLPVDDPTQRKPDITLAKSLLGWEPDIQLHAGLARTAEWMRTVI